MPNKPLRFVSKIKLEDVEYDLAVNGRFTLVAGQGEDAYGVPYAVELDVQAFFGDREYGPERVRQVLDLLGKAIQERDAALAGLHRTAEEKKP